MMAKQLDNPYVGPRAFTKAERNRFFGRDKEAHDLLSLVIAERLVLFFVQSGAGKSSLINTRLLPGLVEKEGFIALPVGRVSGDLPQGVKDVDNIFAFNLMLSIEASQREPGRFAEMRLKDFLANLTTEDGERYFFAETAVSTTDPEEEYEQPPHILVIDQFEEIVNTHLDRWPERAAFFEQLNEAMTADPWLWVVLTLREDYVSQLEPFRRLMLDNMRTRYYMQRMQAVAAQEAVEAPAEWGGRPFAPHVAAALVKNLSQIRVQGEEQIQEGQFIEPVQLQVVCYQLWENLKKRPSGAITQADVDELGDVDEALAQFYVQAIENVLKQSDVSEFELRNWFERKLITPAETRGTAYQGDDTEGLANEVVALLANQYLLRAETRAGGTWYELVHDRFVTPILQSNRDWRAQQSPLIQAAERWDKNGRRRQDLYTGDVLKSALTTPNQETLPALVQSFLTASEDAQSKRELEAEAKRSRTLRWLLGAVGVALLVAIMATIAAILASNRAQASAMEEQTQRTLADEARALAVEQQGTAEAASTRAVAEQITAQAASTAAVDERNSAEVASTSAVEERATAVAASTAAVAAQATAQAAQITTEHQRRLLQAQALAFQSPNVAESELAVLLALEAYNINQVEEGDLEAVVDQAVRKALTTPAFTTILAEFSTIVHELAVSPDGRWLAVADDNSVTILSLVEPDLSSIKNETYASNLAFSANSSSLFILTYSDTIIQINLDDLEAPPITRRDNLSSYYGVIASTHQGSIMALANEDGIELWNSETGEVEQRLPLTDNPEVVAATFSQDDTILAAISQNFLWLWDMTNLDAPPVEIAGEPFYDLRVVALSPDGRWVVASNYYGEIYVFSLSNLDSFIGFGGGEGGGIITSLIFTPDSQQLISAYYDHSIRVWEVETGLPATVYNYHNDSVSTIALSPDGSKLFSGSADRTVRQLFLNRPDLQPTAQAPYRFNSVTYSPNGRWLAMGTNNCSVLLVPVNDLNDFSYELSNIHTEYVNDAVFSPDGRYLASAGMDDIIAIWELGSDNTANAIETLTGHESNVEALAFSPDGQQLASASLDGTVRLWQINPPNSTLIETIDQSEIVHSVAFSPDGTTIAFDKTISGSGSSVRCDSFGGGGGGGGGGGSEEDYGVFLWSVEDTSEPLHFFPSSFSDIYTVAYSPNGQLLAAGGSDRTVRIWSLADFFAEPVQLHDYKGSINVVLFSPDGRLFATLDNNNTVRLYEADQLDKPPIILTSEDYALVDLAFSPDSQTLTAVGPNRIILLPILDVLITTGCDIVTRNFTWTEWQNYFGDEPYRQTCSQLPVHFTVPAQP